MKYFFEIEDAKKTYMIPLHHILNIGTIQNKIVHYFDITYDIPLMGVNTGSYFHYNRLCYTDEDLAENARLLLIENMCKYSENFTFINTTKEFKFNALEQINKSIRKYKEAIDISNEKIDLVNSAINKVKAEASKYGLSIAEFGLYEVEGRISISEDLKGGLSSE